VQPSATHQQVELRFRELVGEAGLASPDRVDYVPGSVIFYWDEPRVAVYVDFDRDEESPLDHGDFTRLYEIPADQRPTTG
jgi:hypothetical protein